MRYACSFVAAIDRAKFGALHDYLFLLRERDRVIASHECFFSLGIELCNVVGTSLFVFAWRFLDSNICWYVSVFYHRLHVFFGAFSYVRPI